MKVCSNNKQIAEVVSIWKSQGKTIALVPTMGGLHAGHLSLVHQAKENADKVIVSIFVNPTQFGEHEDFENYPKTLDQDLSELEACAVDAVFTPDKKQIYPDGFKSPLKAGSLSQGLCGNSRPGHFDGVVQVVNCLFKITKPDVAIFGQKDYQQLLVIEQMVKALALPIKILSGDIVREKNGLAMSTRNQYLSMDERDLATNLYKVLKDLKKEILQDKEIEQARLNSNRALEQHFKIEYLSVLDANTLKSIADNTNKIAILCSVFLGSTRLIDNIIFNKG
ncbi:pantoate--beta-alanine ligase [Candidatus Thioglobus sp.]|nr:pantoate--beta-alanine ligase [Candidatus Thioglobus sp.]MDB3893632.1 pantoate--beta-alanine ligase [Candidatus Thioglobus sp.]MDC0888620.1 pantoate--beta-alanine ligase [Candidatus Thioglobus sp.]MDC0904398.1 pantoate--beta-alanine ligase [Candidatus Thioglobus sp.]MDC0919879.1 pantoate--beta-alanine ligase [Candidatus Thioglobus sp.]